MVMSNENKIKKIQGLLAKSFNNPSEEEAKTALLLAQKLMVKWGIDADEVNKDKEKKKEKIVREIYNSQSVRAEWKVVLASLIARNFRCKMYFLGVEKPYIVFLGVAADAKICLEVFSQTLDFMMKGRDRCYLKMRLANKATKGTKGDYVKGFLAGLADAFKNQIDEQGWGLIIAPSPEVQKEYDSLDFVKDKQAKIRTILTGNNKEAREMGYVDGRSQVPSKKRRQITEKEKAGA
jgi:hypothetical protein